MSKILMPMLLFVIASLFGCSLRTRGVGERNDYSPVSGSLLEKSLLAGPDQFWSDEVSCAVEYLQSHGAPNQLSVGLWSGRLTFEECRTIGRKHLEWLRVQSRQEQEKIVKGFPVFCARRSPYAGPELDRDIYEKEE